MILESELTRRFKQVIRDELYDTGALYESMEIYSLETSNNIIFDIVCNDYIVYHIERLNLLDRLQEFPEFTEAYTRYISPRLEAEIQRSVESLDAEDVSIQQIFPPCLILVNGE